MRRKATVTATTCSRLSGCDYVWLPGGADGKGTWTNDREYVRTAWVNQMIESARERAMEELGKMA